MIEAYPIEPKRFEGYEEYQGIKNLRESNVPVTYNSEYRNNVIEDGIIIRLVSAKVFVKPVTDEKGEPFIHEYGRYKGQTVMAVYLLVEQIDEQGNKIKDIFILANFLERLAYEWSKDEAAKKFVRGARREGTGEVNKLFCSLGDKDIALARVIEEQQNHKGILIKDVPVLTVPFLRDKQLQLNGKTEVPTEGDGKLFDELRTTHVYTCEWVD